MNIDTKLIRELAEMLGETGLTEIEVEDKDRKIRVSRVANTSHSPSQVTEYVPQAPQHAPAEMVATQAPASVPEPATDVADALMSPMVGTAYLSPDPQSQPFVKIGDSVKEGDTILIVEAMKVMNPITADKSGTITHVLVENAQPVEFGQPLIVIA